MYPQGALIFPPQLILSTVNKLASELFSSPHPTGSCSLGLCQVNYVFIHLPHFFSLTMSFCNSMVASGSLLVSLKLMFLLSPWHEVEDDEEGPAVDVELRSPS